MTAAPRPLRAVRDRRRPPADPFRRRRTVALAVLATAAAAAGTWWVLTGPPVGIHGVAVEGYDGPNRAAVETTARLVAGEGTILDLPVGPMRAALTRFPWIEDVSLARDFPRGIRVEVTQAEPAAVAVPARGRKVLLTAEGRVLGLAPSRGGLARVRLAGTAPAEGGRVTEADARRSLQLVRSLAPALAGRLRDLRVEDGEMVGRLAGGPELRLGPPEGLALKAKALTAVLGHLSADQERSARYLDVSVPDRPALGGTPPDEEDAPQPAA
jgi:cell division septal protein FtsQ